MKMRRAYVDAHTVVLKRSRSNNIKRLIKRQVGALGCFYLMTLLYLISLGKNWPCRKITTDGFNIPAANFTTIKDTARH